MLAAGISDYLYKRAQTRGVQPLTFIAVQSLFYNVCVFALAAYYGVQLSLAAVLYGVAAGYTALPGVVLLLRSLRHGDATINVPIYRLSFILTAVGAMLFLNEPARPTKLLAIVLAAASILMLSNVGLLRKGPVVSGMGSLLVGAVCYSSFGLVYKAAMLAGITPSSLLVVQAPLVLLTSAGLALTAGPVKVDGAVLRNAPWCGVLLLSSMFLLLLSLQQGEASINVPIVQLSFVFTSALAVLLLGERLTLGKALGIAMATLAVVVFGL